MSTDGPKIVFSHPAIYREGGVFEDIHAFPTRDATSQIHLLQEIFPPEAPSRSKANIAYAENTETFESLMSTHVDHVSAVFNKLCASAIVVIRNAWIYNGIIILEHQEARVDQYAILYETWRNIDRYVIEAELLSRFKEQLLARNYEARVSSSFVASAGFTNYGHWLVDDLPRCLALIENGCPSTILSTAWSDGLDAIKKQTCDLCFPTHDVHLDFIPYQKPVFVRELYYCTPVTYHPTMKSASGIRNLRSIVLQQTSPSDSPRRIFVNRLPETGRNITNYDELREILQKYNIEEVFCETLSFKQQVLLFSQADLILGVMGAAMTNITFCNETTKILFLAPTGWHDIFFWDLCDCLGLVYSVQYGESGITHAEPRIDFTIDVKAIEDFIRSTLA